VDPEAMRDCMRGARRHAKRRVRECIESCRDVVMEQFEQCADVEGRDECVAQGGELLRACYESACGDLPPPPRMRGGEREGEREHEGEREGEREHEGADDEGADDEGADDEGAGGAQGA